MTRKVSRLALFFLQPVGALRRLASSAVVALVSLLAMHVVAWAVMNGRPDSEGRFGNVVRIRAGAIGVLSGVLIEPDVVLTSAHGLVGRDGALVAAGSVLVEQASGGPSRTSRGRSIVVDPAYLRDGWSEQADLGVIYLDRPLSMRQSVLLLPSEGWNEQWLQDSLERDRYSFKGVIAGYGSTTPCERSGEGCRLPDSILTGEVRVHHAWVCKTMVRPDFSATPRLIDRMFCAEGESRTAPGDSGGPLFLELKNGSLLLVGLTSNGPHVKYADKISDRFTAVHSGLAELRSLLPRPIAAPLIECSSGACGAGRTETAAVAPAPAVEARAVERAEGWWVVLGSIPNPDLSSPQEEKIRALRRSAARCGLEPFNDFSSKFRGFAPGYDVVAVGAYATSEQAKQVMRRARDCVPDAYVKYGRYTGE